MKYMMLALSIISINSMGMDHVVVTYVPVAQTPVTPRVSHYDQAHDAIMCKKTTDFEALVTRLPAEDQIALCHVAQSELKKVPSHPKLVFKKSLLFLTGLGVTAIGGLNFLLAYASGQVKETCQTDCIAITRAVPGANGGSLCKNVCATISQDKIHFLALLAGIITAPAGIGVSGHSLYSLCTHWNDETKLRSMISILQASNHYSGNDIALNTLPETAYSDSDSAEIV